MGVCYAEPGSGVADHQIPVAGEVAIQSNELIDNKGDTDAAGICE